MDIGGVSDPGLELGVKLFVNDPPRVYTVGVRSPIQMKDCARIQLEPEEQVTFVTETGAEYDVAAKSWGFYATPSLNGRLCQFGLRGVIAKSPGGRYYVMLVAQGKDDEFRRYLDEEGHSIVCWLDSQARLEELERKLTS